jgi:xanthine dehydrogenase YagT iron-sulfur-binding subunit
MSPAIEFELRRRTFLAGSATIAGVVAFPGLVEAQDRQAGVETPVGPVQSTISLTVNGEQRTLQLDNRTSLLDALREHLQLTGTKKGCDHGQCGACTIILNGQRVNSCLSLAVMHDGDELKTIEGTGAPGDLDPMQTAFIEYDAFQCGYCTPGQICSANAVIEEIRAGIPSHATDDLIARIEASEAEIRERMSGNICRCGAYANILAAITEVAETKS